MNTPNANNRVKCKLPSSRAGDPNARDRGKFVGAARTHNVIQNLPVIVRTFNACNDEDNLARYALLCMLGEKINITTLQVFWLNRIYHECPNNLNFREWIYQTTFEENGLTEIFSRDVVKMQNQPVDKEAILSELKVISTCISDHRSEIGTLMGVSSIGYTADTGDVAHNDSHGEKYLDLRRATFYHLTQLKLMEPYTAAKFMLMTRPSEHVLLTSIMLQWGNTVPAVIGIDRNLPKDTPPKQLPAKTPVDPHEYAQCEYYVRREQRTYFPGLTSLECHILIHSDGEKHHG